jgi:uracil-DNA glycosylase
MTFETLAERIRACRICVEAPLGRPLPHAPRPVFQGLPSARVMLVGQAPGTKVHASGRPFTDASGDRLRTWLGMPPAVFYDAARVAIVPMGFCFPGQDDKGADLPPRRECMATWHDGLMPHFPDIEVLVVNGSYAQAYHFRRLGLEELRGRTLNDTVANWRAVYAASTRPRVFAVPHPSWRNSGWLKRNPWFETDLLPVLQADIARALTPSR